MTLTSTPLLTVSQLTFQIKSQLETNFSKLMVQGEITNCKLNSSGHIYFDLKDMNAKLPAVMFKGKTANLPRPLKEGDQVIAKGTLSLYAPQGRYQLLVESIEYKGIGALLLQLEELKRRLKEKGWFASERKKPLPPFPKKIGVVTSPTGAVIRDILHILSKRYKGFHLLLNPVRVQGEGAALEIARAIDDFNAHQLVDVIIVARGGGSLEDLWPFNEECVASAIFQSKIPVISAVGHETDFTIADFVADVRAPTPTAAAHLVIAEKEAKYLFLKKSKQAALHAISHVIQRYQSKLQGFLRHPLLTNPYLIVGNPFQKLDEIKKKIDHSIRVTIKEKENRILSKRKELIALNPLTKITFLKTALGHYQKRVDFTIKHRLQQQQGKLSTLKEHLYSLDPKNVLKRGYSILFAQKSGSVIVSTHMVSCDDEVKVLLSDGNIRMRVIE